MLDNRNAFPGAGSTRSTSGSIFALGTEPVAVAYRECGYTLREIAEHLGCHYSTVSRGLRREELVFSQCKT